MTGFDAYEQTLALQIRALRALADRESEKRQALTLWERRLHEILGLAETISNVIPFER